MTNRPLKMTNKELYRYSRHILLPEIGQEGQEKLKKARVLVIGAGGLGSPCLQYLAAAGIGSLGVIDDDVVDDSNLQRQILFTTDDIGKNKAECVVQTLSSLNPFIQVEAHCFRLDISNAVELFRQYDVVVDGSDNFATRYLVNDASLLTNTPLVYGSIYKFEGQISVFNYKEGPSYRCLFPHPPEVGEVPGCGEVGVLGVLPGIIGSLQANEVLKILLSIGQVLKGKLLIYDMLSSDQNVVDFSRVQEEIDQVLEKGEEGFEETDYQEFCGLDTVPFISVKDFLIAKNQFFVIDIREKNELPRLDQYDVKVRPQSSWSDNVLTDKKTILVCQSGVRSRALVKQLLESGFNNVVNLQGGVNELMKMSD